MSCRASTTGRRRWTARIELARAAAAQGTTVLVATPHVTYDHLHNTSERILASVEKVNRALRKQRIDLMVLPGAEVALERAGELEDDELAALRLGGGPWLLVECPMFAGGMGVDGQLHALASRGNRIVLAHPERCPVFQTRPRPARAPRRGGDARADHRVGADGPVRAHGGARSRATWWTATSSTSRRRTRTTRGAGRRSSATTWRTRGSTAWPTGSWTTCRRRCWPGTSIPYRPRAERAQGRKGLFGRRGKALARCRRAESPVLRPLERGASRGSAPSGTSCRRGTAVTPGTCDTSPG